MSPSALLLIAALVHLAPEHVGDLLNQSPGAWEYVARGIEGVALWGIVGDHYQRPDVWAVSSYGMWESAQLAACRAAHPMDTPPALEPGQGLCTAAGWPLGYWAPLIVAAICFVVSATLTRKTL